MGEEGGLHSIRLARRIVCNIFHRSEMNTAGLLVGDHEPVSSDARSSRRGRDFDQLYAAARPAPSWDLIVIAAAFTLYSAIFILRTSFVIGGRRYFFLADDQMISMVFARNLARGLGLVFNPGGPRIEGFTNPLWVAIMTVIHLFRIPNRLTSLCVQVLAVILLNLNLVVVGRTAGQMSPRPQRIVLIATILTAFYYPLVNWSLQGTEVSLLTLMVSSAVYLSIRSEKDHEPISLYLLLAIATLVRLDMVVFDAMLLSFLAVEAGFKNAKRVTLGSLVILSLLCLQFFGRFIYYGGLLPNTYYLKMTGYPLLYRFSRGIFVNCIFFIEMLPFAVLIRTRFSRSKTSRPCLLLLWCCLGQVGYSIYVGGDAWEWWGGSNRYTSIVMPLFFILTAEAINHLADPLLSQFSRSCYFKVIFSPRASGIVIGCTVLAVINFSSLWLGPALNFGPVKGALQALERPLLIVPPPQVDENEGIVREALLLKRLTSKDAVIAVVWAGGIPYFSQRIAVDLLGKSDSRIAHEPMHVPSGGFKWIGFYPGHLKFDLNYSVGVLQPDIVAQWWFLFGPSQKNQVLAQSYEPHPLDGQTIFLRRDSTKVLKQELSQAQTPSGANALLESGR